jgi:hypothetical protein
MYDGKQRSIVRRGLAAEAGGWISLGRWITRRPRVPAGATPFANSGPIVPVLIAFTVVSAIEVVVVDLIVHRWPVIRVLCLVLGIWGVTFMLGMLASARMNPHAVGPAGLLVRSGTAVRQAVGWAQIEEVRAQTYVREKAKPIQLDGPVLNLVVQSATTVVVRLREPVVVRLPDRDAEVTEIRFHADDPAALVAAARGHLVAA